MHRNDVFMKKILDAFKKLNIKRFKTVLNMLQMSSNPENIASTLFLDLSKVLHCISHEILLNKLPFSLLKQKTMFIEVEVSRWSSKIFITISRPFATVCKFYTKLAKGEKYIAKNVQAIFFSLSKTLKRVWCIPLHPFAFFAVGINGFKARRHSINLKLLFVRFQFITLPLKFNIFSNYVFVKKDLLFRY